MFHLPALAWVALAFVPAQSSVAEPELTEEERAFVERVLAVVRESPPPAPVSRGTRTITGRIATEAGAPVAGVRLVAREVVRSASPLVRRPSWDPAYDTKLDLESRLRRSLEWTLSYRRREHETTSDTDGRFAFAGLGGQRYELTATLERFALRATENDSPFRWNRVQVAPDADVEFVAMPLLDVTFALALPDGTPPANATLAFRRIGGRDESWEQQWTPGAARIAAPEGEWMVAARVVSPGSVEQTHELLDFVADERLVAIVPEAPSVPFSLRGVARLSGSIRMGSGSGRRSVRIEVVPLAEGETTAPVGDPRRGRNRNAHNLSHYSTSDDRRYFDDPKITAGRWSVSLIDSSSGARLEERVVEVADRPVTVDFELAPPAPEERVRVRVLAPDGAPLSDCAFELATGVVRDGRSSMSSSGGIERRREPGGGFTFLRHLLKERNLLIARHPHLGFVAATVAPDAADVELRFAEPALVTLDLSGGLAHTAARSVELVVDGPLEQFDGGLAPRSLRFVDAALPSDGRLDLGPLPPGTWRARLIVDSDRDDGRSGAQVASTSWKLAAGPVALEWRWPELSTLRVKVKPGEKSGWTLELLDGAASDETARWTRWVEATADGELLFVHMPSGLYRLSGPGKEAMKIELPQLEPVVFRAMAVNALRVVISDPSGALVHEGLAHGDLVVALDGQEFANREELQSLRSRIAQQKDVRVTLTIERAGERFEVVLARALLTDRREAGGTFVDETR